MYFTSFAPISLSFTKIDLLPPFAVVVYLLFSFPSPFYLSLALSPHSLTDGLLVVVGDTLASNYLVVYLTGGRVALTFNSDSSDPDMSVTIDTTESYADSELYALRVVFDAGTIRLTLNGTERLTTECEKSEQLSSTTAIMHEG